MVVRFASKHHRIGALVLPPHTLPTGAPGVIAWQRIVERLYEASSAVETITPGTAVFALHPTLYDTLREMFPHAQLGLADTCEQAQLAAHAHIGVITPRTPLAGIPLTHLPAPLSADEFERLAWLGVRTLGDIRTWSSTQIEHVLGPAAARIMPFVHGPERQHVQPDPKPTHLSVRYDATAVLAEPHEWLPILTRLVTRLQQRLIGRGSRMFELALDSAVYSDVTKWELHHTPELLRAFERLAQQHRGSFTSLTVTAFAVTRAVQQDTLWQQDRPVDVLAHELALRFPGQFVQCRWVDPRSQAADLAWEWQPRS